MDINSTTESMDRFIHEAADWAVLHKYDPKQKQEEPWCSGWMIPVKIKAVRSNSDSSSTSSNQDRRSLLGLKGDKATASSSSAGKSSSSSSTSSPVLPDPFPAEYKTWRPDYTRPYHRDMRQLIPIVPAASPFTSSPSSSSFTALDAAAATAAKGSHALRADPDTGRLYACLPKAAWRDRAPFCDHCGPNEPRRILDARALCRFHAWFVSTGRLLSYYEQLALDYLDDKGVVLDVPGMVRAVGILDGAIRRRLLVQESHALTMEECAAKDGAFGVIGHGRP